MFLEIRFSLILKVKRGISCLAKSLRNTCQVVLCTNNDDDDDDDDDDIYIYIYILYIYNKSFLPTYLWFTLQPSISQKVTQHKI